MDSSVRDSKVNPIENLGIEQESLLTSRDGGDDGKEEVKAKTKRRVNWTDNHGNQLAQVMVFPTRDPSDGDAAKSGSCSCTIL